MLFSDVQIIVIAFVGLIVFLIITGGRRDD